MRYATPAAIVALTLAVVFMRPMAEAQQRPTPRPGETWEYAMLQYDPPAVNVRDPSGEWAKYPEIFRRYNLSVPSGEPSWQMAMNAMAAGGWEYADRWTNSAGAENFLMRRRKF